MDSVYHHELTACCRITICHIYLLAKQNFAQLLFIIYDKIFNYYNKKYLVRVCYSTVNINFFASWFDVLAIDDGKALKQLILAEKDLLANNFPQGLMTIACVAIGANYDLVIKKYGGCALPVLYGAPQSAKTTALKAALSVVGNPDIVQGLWCWMYITIHRKIPVISCPLLDDITEQAKCCFIMYNYFT